MNKKLIILLTLPIAVLLFISIYWAIYASFGQEVKVAIRGYDPRDILSGHYISYTINWDDTDCTQFTDNLCPQTEFCHNENCKFYIPEASAEQLERLLNTSAQNFHIIYRYKLNQPPVALQLLINGQPWQTFLSEN